MNDRSAATAGSTAAAPGSEPSGRASQLGRPRGCSRAAVVTAALEIAAEKGVDAVSMRSVARRLGLHQTSLYTYVATKDDLLTAMLDTVFAEQLPLPPADDAREPVEQLTSIFSDLRRLALDHVELLGLVGRLPATTTAPVRSLDRIMNLLGQLGLRPPDQAAVYALLHHVTVSSALIAGNRRRAGDDVGRARTIPWPRVSEPDRYPDIARVVASVRGDETEEDAFAELLRIVFEVTVPALATRTAP